MANNLSSNTTANLAKVFVKGVESSRVLINTVNRTSLDGMVTPASGTTVYVKRPHQYGVISTAAGDISAATKSDIIAGRAAGVVQNVQTVAMEWDTLAEATTLDQLEEILNPASERLVIGIEALLGAYMLKNAGHTFGTMSAAVDSWQEVADAGAFLHAIGAPMSGNRYYAMNPFIASKLAGAQSSLNADAALIRTAWENAQITSAFGGFRAITSNALTSFTSTTAADRAGALAANPDVTYVTAKDSDTQTLAVTGFSANATIKAGDTIEVTGRYMINTKNGQILRNAAGTAQKWRCTVTADVLLDGAGAGNVVVTPAAIYEATGNYNTTDSALVQNDVVTLISATATSYQPNMFYHEDAFGIATVKLPKLYSTDTIFTTKDGLSFRVSRYSDGDKNKQMVRFDCVPVFATFKSAWAGQAYGS